MLTAPRQESAFNPTHTEQHTLAPEAEELPELPSEFEFEEEEGDRELSPNDKFNEAIAQIPDEESAQFPIGSYSETRQ